MRNRFDDAKAQRYRRLALHAEITLETMLDGKQVFGVVEKALAGRGQAKLPVPPVDQFQANFGFKDRDPVGDRRLRQAQFFSRSRDALQSGDPHEGLNKT